jgi:hypothetical protein
MTPPHWRAAHGAYRRQRWWRLARGSSHGWFRAAGAQLLAAAGGMLKPRLRHGHYELAVVELVNRRVAVAFDRLALAI